MGSQSGTVARRARSISNLYTLSLGQGRLRRTVSALAAREPCHVETFAPDNTTTPAHGHTFNGDTVFKMQKRVQIRYSIPKITLQISNLFQPDRRPHPAWTSIGGGHRRALRLRQFFRARDALRKLRSLPESESYTVSSSESYTVSPSADNWSLAVFLSAKKPPWAPQQLAGVILSMTGRMVFASIARFIASNDSLDPTGMPRTVAR